MKTTLTQKLLGLALSVFSMTAVAQCPTVTNMNVTLGANGTATVTPVFSSATSTMTMYYWSVTPSATQTSGIWQSNGTFQFPANGSYTLSVNANDSLTGCTATGVTAVTISNMSATSCSAAFTAYTDSSCITHFMNGSVGNNLTFNWSINGSTFSSYNPTHSLPNGNYPVILRVFSGGAFCDSVYHMVTVACGGGTTTPTGCNASFTSYTDSNCVTHFVNTSTGSSYGIFNINGTTYTATANPNVSLPNGTYSAYLTTYNTFGVCDSVSQMVTVACGTGTTTPTCQVNAGFQIFADSVNAGNYFAYNTSTGNGGLSYLWNFGDGTTSTQQYPFHQYAIPGQYVVCVTVTNTIGGLSCTDTDCDSSSVQRIASGFLMSQLSILPQTVTGIHKMEMVTGVKAFPNPFADELTVEAISIDNAKLIYVLTDALGRTVATGDLNNSKAQISTNDLAKGFYSLSITNEKGNNLKTIKLVK
ncbi:MAG: PKD domain-containing protein [Bacteroidota bacterium]